MRISGSTVLLTGASGGIGHAIAKAVADRGFANAGLPASGTLESFTVGEIDRALDVNLRAPVVSAKLAAGQRVKR